MITGRCPGSISKPTSPTRGRVSLAMISQSGRSLRRTRRISGSANRQWGGETTFPAPRRSSPKSASRSASQPDGSGRSTWRYFGPRPLTRGQRVHSPRDRRPQRACRVYVGQRLAAAARRPSNVTNSRSDQITYAYGSFLKTDSLFKACNAPGSNGARRRLRERRHGPRLQTGRAIGSCV